MVTTFYPPYHFGGDALFVYRLSEALAERGHSVDVIHSVDAYRLQHPQEPEKTFSHHPNVTRYELKTTAPKLSALAAHQLGSPAVYARKLRQLLEQDYDVIHYHNISLMGGPGVLEEVHTLHTSRSPAGAVVAQCGLDSALSARSGLPSSAQRICCETISPGRSRLSNAGSSPFCPVSH